MQRIYKVVKENDKHHVRGLIIISFFFFLCNYYYNFLL